MLSATDLKRCFESQCCDAKVLFKGLHLPIKTWFESYGFHLNNHDANCHTVTKETTTAQVVEQIYQHHLHRVFIVDGELHPTGVISLCDLITQLQLAWQPEFCWKSLPGSYLLSIILVNCFWCANTICFCKHKNTAAHCEQAVALIHARSRINLNVCSQKISEYDKV